MCHKDHEGLEYDGQEVGFCDCGKQAKGCQVVVTDTTPLVLKSTKLGRPTQIYERYREEMEILKFRDFVHRMENRLLESEEFLPSVTQPRHLTSLPLRWAGSASESDKDIGKESSESQEIVESKSPRSPTYNINVAKGVILQPQQQQQKKKSRSGSVSISEEEIEDEDDLD